MKTKRRNNNKSLPTSKKAKEHNTTTWKESKA
jgi:hypothetical protein